MTNKPKEEKKNSKSKGNPYLYNYAKYSALAIQLIVIILGAVWGGYELDQYLSFAFPLFTLLFSAIAIVIVIYLFIRSVLQ